MSGIVQCECGHTGTQHHVHFTWCRVWGCTCPGWREKGTMTKSILIIKGEHDDVIAVRKGMIEAGVKTSHIIFHEGQRNKHVPDLQDGYDEFDELFEHALHGPRIEQRKREMAEEEKRERKEYERLRRKYGKR